MIRKDEHDEDEDKVCKKEDRYGEEFYYISNVYFRFFSDW